jgi:hypothetical protein
VRNHYGVGDLEGSSSSQQGQAGWEKLWQVRVPSKVSIFDMKVANNGLPTRVNKKYRHLEQQDVALRKKITHHALLACPHAVALRQAMRDHWSFFFSNMQKVCVSLY